MGEELEVKERMSTGWGWRVVLDGTSPSFRVFCVRDKERYWRGKYRRVAGVKGMGLNGC